MNISTTLTNKTTFFDDYLNANIYNLLDKTFIIPSTFEYKIFVVEDQYIMRPDLISLDAYGDVMYADVICKLNGVNPFEINANMELVLPTPDCIMDFVIQPDVEQLETGNDALSSILSNVPVAKTRAQKRRANEAVIGDRRFNIDPVNGIVIY